MPTLKDDSHRFTQALQRAEKNRDASELVAVFSEDASLDSIGLHQSIHGKREITDFWESYLAMFQSISTTFTMITTGDLLNILEWRSKGVLADGLPVEYRGVTLLKFAGGMVQSFRTYYDSAAFVPEFEKHLKRKKISHS